MTDEELQEIKRVLSRPTSNFSHEVIGDNAYAVILDDNGIVVGRLPVETAEFLSNAPDWITSLIETIERAENLAFVQQISDTKEA